jgi:hypothetical protein
VVEEIQTLPSHIPFTYYLRPFHSVLLPFAFFDRPALRESPPPSLIVLPSPLSLAAEYVLGGDGTSAREEEDEA